MVMHYSGLGNHWLNDLALKLLAAYNSKNPMKFTINLKALIMQICLEQLFVLELTVDISIFRPMEH